MTDGAALMTSTGSLESCALIIPVFNEEDAIRSTVERLQKIVAGIAHYRFEIICINDGSSDSTAKILAAIPGITVLTHFVNRGYGAALRSGLDYCSTDWAFIVDADGTYPLEDLPRFFLNVSQQTDLVVGARSGPGISSNPMKRLARWFLRKMVHGLTGVMVPDLNSGMRIFRTTLYHEFRHLLPLKFSFTSTLTVASLYSGYRITYLPIRYEKRIGKSNIRPVKDFFGFSILIIRLATYFDPLRFFLPLASFVFIIAFAKAARDFIELDHIGSFAVILFFFAVQFFVTGVLCDAIMRRSQDVSGSMRKKRFYEISRESEPR